MIKRFFACFGVALCTLLAWLLGFFIESRFDDLALQLQIVLPMLVIGISILWVLMRCMDGAKSVDPPADAEQTKYRFRIK